MWGDARLSHAVVVQFQRGMLLVSNSRVNRNAAITGGAVYQLTGANVMAWSSNVSMNTAETSGGAFMMYDGDVTLVNCTVDGNSAPTGFAGTASVLTVLLHPCGPPQLTLW